MLWPTLGFEVIDFLEEYGCHGPGDVRGKPLDLTAEARRFILRAYEIHPREQCGEEGCACIPGRRRFDWAVLSRLKGWAKTELGALLCLAELRAPVRFDGWDAEGQPVGRPVRSPFIPIAATSEEQAEDTLFGALYVICTEGGLSGALDIGKDRIIDPVSGGEAKLVTSSSVSREGGRPSFTAVEEQHLWYAPDLLAMDRVLRRNLAKRAVAEPWGLSVTTMFAPGQGTPVEQDYEAHQRGDRSILFDHREAREGFDTSTEEGLRAAIKDAAGDAYWLDVDRVARSYRRNPEEGERYWLNRYRITRSMAVDPRVWDKAKGDGMPEDGAPIALGFDGSMYEDCTALLACPLDGSPAFPVGIWVPDGTEERMLEIRREVRAELGILFDRYSVTRMYCDPPHWQDELDQWRREYGERKVIPWWTNRDTAMAYATHRFITALNEGTFRHNGDALLRTHALNVRKRTVRAAIDGRPGWVPTKERGDSPKKIDGAVALILAWEARADSLVAGLDKRATKRSRKIYAF